MNELVDSKFFSQRAKQISSWSKPIVKTENHFPFSNRKYPSKKDVEIIPTGHGHENAIPIDSHPSMNTSRGRTTVPLSPFVLQKDPLPTTSMPSPIFVMHDEVQFVRPYFGPRDNNSKDMQSAAMARKREILLSALQEIESDLKTL